MLKEREILRAFVAVVPPGDVLDRLERFALRLRPMALFKWTTREQWHITLRFLGEARRGKIEAFAETLGKMEAGKPFYIRLNRAGGFPNFARGQVRALWLSGDEGEEGLTALAGRVEQVSVTSGFPPETKKFTPHLTLARLREAASLALAEALAEVPPLAWRCEEFSLFRSELTPEGAVYTPLRHYPLACVDRSVFGGKQDGLGGARR